MTASRHNMGGLAISPTTIKCRLLIEVRWYNNFPPFTTPTAKNGVVSSRPPQNQAFENLQNCNLQNYMTYERCEFFI